ncbi:MAG: flagellar basal body P-ring formation protein FlgA [Phycisphaerales bacterium]|nr:MAG: flagellar basal body P-ring formation protein FlgA [Phycisphaerales bacterium]
MIMRKGPRAHKYGRAGVLAVCAVITLSLFHQASAESNAVNAPKDFDLRIYLPREVTVKDSSLSLGQISIVRGRESLTAKANKIALGRFSVPGQEIVLDRHMILSRLACNGIPASRVSLTGAEKIRVKQKFKIIRRDQFVTAARSFLEVKSPQDSGRTWNLIRAPKDFVVSGVAKGVTFSPRLVASKIKNQARVEIAVLCDDKKIGIREVIFDLKYACRQAVAKADIAAGAVIDPNNVRIDVRASSRPERTDWKSPYGLFAKRALRADTVIRPHMIGPAKSPIIVKRNQSVVIRIENPAFLITAAGVALVDGKAGENIKVRNVDSQRIIVARINDDGTVEPVL